MKAEIKEGGMLVENSLLSGYYEQYADIVTRAAWHFTGNIHAAQDCTQEAFLRLMNEQDMEEGHVLPWLIHTAVNIAKDIVKSAENSRTVPLDEFSGERTSDETILKERAAMRAMLAIEEKYRLPLYLHCAQGYTILETARITGKSFNTTASLIRRGRKLLQKAFEKEEY